MTDENVREVAIAKRWRRMRNQLGISAFASTMADIVFRGALSHGVSKGTNMLLFGGLAAVIYFAMKRAILAGDTTSFAWKGRNPWLLVYWPLAGLTLILLQTRFIGGN
ncbi:hypothetical protein [Sphingobium xenophagum]|uniref:hypothetical protein n=1 Tax=Sphingobium xenophagum TaxID=121428 RepID=UPI0012FB9E36|nr:hypothetical protein [Sphingobium xenophagum]